MSKLGSFLVRELREALPAAAFFFVLLHLVALTKVALLEDESFSALRATGATIGALLVAKAVLLIDALRVPRFAAGSNAARILWRTLLGALAVLAFKTLEEWLPRLRDAGAADAWRALLDEVRWPIFGVLALWIVAGLWLFTLVTELSRGPGVGSLRAFLRRAPVGG